MRPEAAAAQTAPPPAAPAPFNFAKAIAEKRTSWTQHSSRIAELLQILKAKAPIVARLDPQIQSTTADLKALEREKERALDELRSGMFCSGCNKTRSEILAAGDQFPHSGQQSIPASPEQIAAAERDFDQRIDRLRRQLARMHDERKQAQSAIDAALHELNVRVHNYHQDMMAEARLRGDRWADEKRTLEQGLDALQKNIETAGKTAAETKDPQLAAAVRTNLGILQRQFAESLQRARSAEARERQDALTFATTAKADLERLRAVAADVPQQFGIPGGWYLGHLVGNPPLPISYRVGALKNYALPTPTDEMRALLEGTSKPSKATTAPDSSSSSPARKSMRDLLEGK